jgi:hypothetical protein
LDNAGNKFAFFLTTGTLGVPQAGYYAEIGDLTINGTRLLF